MTRFVRQAEADVAIVGFGFSGLAALTELVTGPAAPRRIAVVAPDPSGHGLAYATRDPGHLLNVRAAQMSARASRPDDFVRWLATADAARRCRLLGTAVPAPDEFAPRALYARYLTATRDAALRAAQLRGTTVDWISARATSIDEHDRGWRIAAGAWSVQATQAVLATGNEQRSVFGEVAHEDLHQGPWRLVPERVARWRGPVVLVGSGLTAVDTLLSLRRMRYAGEIVALSRNGLLPRAHRPVAPQPHPLGEDVLGASTLAELEAALGRAVEAAGDWQAVLEAVRPCTPDLWQRLAARDQRALVERWSARWNVHRHRMAPPVAAAIRAELDRGTLRVEAARDVRAQLVDGHLEVLGGPRPLRPAAVIDCTGPVLDWSRSADPLRRGLIDAGVCTPHPTGLGLVADDRHGVADGLFALGSALVGQRWESVAVPELREQAATIAAAATDRLAAVPHSL